MFHVPEKFRVVTGLMGSNSSYGNNGRFHIPGPKRKSRELVIIASDGAGWEHVSAHATEWNKPYLPSWQEMCYLKDLFWDGEDVVVQFHPRKSEYVNNHPHTLHLWRRVGSEFPTPPSILVGIRG